MRHVAQRPHRIAQGQRRRQEALLDHLQHEERGAHFQIGGVLGHVGVADDDVQAAIAVAVGVRLVTGIDDGALHHRVEAHFGFEEIRPLRDLVGHRLGAVFGSDLAGAAVDLARHQERHQVLRQQLEGRAAVQEVILVVAVAAAFAVAVVLVDDDRVAVRQERVGTGATAVQDALTGLFVAQQVEDVRALGRRVFRVRVIHVEPRAVVEDLVQRHVVLLVRHLARLVVLEAARVDQRLLLIVIPQQPRRLAGVVAVDQQQRRGDRIETPVVLHREPEFRFRPDDLGECHDASAMPAQPQRY